MTSTSSAAATGLPNRRRLLSTLVAVGAVGLPAPHALAAAPGPIEAMFSEHLRLEDAFGEAATRAIDAEQRYQEPARPVWHPLTSAGAHEIVPTRKGRGYVYLDVGYENVAYRRACSGHPCR